MDNDGTNDDIDIHTVFFVADGYGRRGVLLNPNICHKLVAKLPTRQTKPVQHMHSRADEGKTFSHASSFHYSTNLHPQALPRPPACIIYAENRVTIRIPEPFEVPHP